MKAVSAGGHGGAYFGGSHALALLDDGSAMAWGSNDLGQCDVPELRPGESYTEVDAGAHSYSVARRNDGALVLEVHEDNADRVRELLDDLGYTDTAVQVDLAGKPRIVEGRWRPT